MVYTKFSRIYHEGGKTTHAFFQHFEIAFPCGMMHRDMEALQRGWHSDSKEGATNKKWLELDRMSKGPEKTERFWYNLAWHPRTEWDDKTTPQSSSVLIISVCAKQIVSTLMSSAVLESGMFCCFFCITRSYCVPEELYFNLGFPNEPNPRVKQVYKCVPSFLVLHGFSHRSTQSSTVKALKNRSITL